MYNPGVIPGIGHGIGSVVGSGFGSKVGPKVEEPKDCLVKKQTTKISPGIGPRVDFRVSGSIGPEILDFVQFLEKINVGT